jgi:glutamine amidotransferase
MCELLAITSKKPTTVSMSLDQFASHGSDASANRDGWGIVYYAEDDIRRFRDTGPAAASEWVKFVEKQELRSTLFLAHIRNANVGKVSLPNTHPFSRELGGSMHTFAHNGFLENISNNSAFALRRFMPLGETDSEWAFCALLERLCSIWMAKSRIPDLADRYKIIATFARQIREFGLANFIYCDGDTMFVHADRRRHADGEFREPGLCLSQQTCSGGSEKISGGGVNIGSPRQPIVMAASVPLTDDGWEPMHAGSLVAMKDGEISMVSEN